MTFVDFPLLRQRIATAARHTFHAVRTAHPNEQLYAFALYTDDTAVGVVPSLNTEEAYQRTIAKLMADEETREWYEEKNISFADSLLGDYRWSPYEWNYECVEREAFEPVMKLINNRGMGFYDEHDPLGFVKFKAGVLAAMVLALADLELEGVFGRGSDREALTVYCSIPSSDCTVWLEQDSARRLNPPQITQTFARERIKYIADGSETTPDEVREHYLALVDAAP